MVRATDARVAGTRITSNPVPQSLKAYLDEEFKLIQGEEEEPVYQSPSLLEDLVAGLKNMGERKY